MRCPRIGRTHDHPVTAVENEGYPHLLTVAAADLEALRTPTPIRLVRGNSAVVSPLGTAEVTVEQQTIGLQDPIDPSVIGRLVAPGPAPAV